MKFIHPKDLLHAASAWISMRMFFVTLCAATASTGWSQETHIDNHAQRRQAAVAQRVAVAGGDLVSLADAQFRAGWIDQAINNFESEIRQRPTIEPYLWQYGIALFFAARYEDGRDLFEKHRLVNPNDVENAAWHFLCVAKADGIDEARRLALPAPNDRRIPMRQILQRLSAAGDTEQYDAAIESATESMQGKIGYASAKLYADLYRGMIADAEGETDVAKRLLSAAAATSLTHYMADIARVYAEQSSPIPAMQSDR